MKAAQPKRWTVLTSALVAIVCLYFFVSALKPLIKYGDRYVHHDTLLGLPREDFGVLLIVLGVYINVVSRAPSTYRWIIVGVEGLGLGSIALLDYFVTPSSTVYGLGHVIYAALMFAVVCVPLLKFYHTDPRQPS